MANVIWKHRLEVPMQTGFLARDIDLPVDAAILSVAAQSGQLTMWMMLDPDKPRVWRRFEVIGTGIRFDDGERRFIGTVLLGYFVWHVFEVLGQQSKEGTNERN